MVFIIRINPALPNEKKTIGRPDKTRYTITMQRKNISLLLVFVFFTISMMSCQTKSSDTTTKAKHERAALYWKPFGTIQESSRLFQWELSTRKESYLSELKTMGKTFWISLSPDQQKIVCTNQSDPVGPEKKHLYWTDPNGKDQDWKEFDQGEKDSDFQSPYWFPDSSGFLYIKAVKQTQSGDFIHFESYNLMDARFSSNKAPVLIYSFQSLISSVSWSPDQISVAFFAQTGKEMKLWVYNKQTGILSPLCTVEADQYSKNRIHWQDENTIIWLEIKTLFSWDIGQQQKSTLVTMPEAILSFDFYLPSSSICMVYTLTEPKEKTVCVLYSWLNKKNLTLATGYQIDSPRFSPDGSKLLFFHRILMSEKPDLVYYTIQTQEKLSLCTVGKITIYPWDTNPTYAVWSPDSCLILLENKQEESSQMQLYSVSPPRMIKEFNPSDYIYAYSFSPSGDWIRILYPDGDQTKIFLFQRHSGAIGEFNGEWLGWSTEDVT